MKKYIIAIIFILGIMPNFNGDIISGVSKVSSQALGYEWWEDQDDCSYNEAYCSKCNDCYDSYDNSICPTCCTDKCKECGTEYSCNGSHECKESGSNVEKKCTICGQVHNGYCPFGDICWKCGLYKAECICHLFEKKK